VKRWYAVYTKARDEAVAEEQLRRQGFEVFLPQYEKRRSHARKVDVVTAPLFPRYLFIAFDAGEGGWRVIRSTRGVIDLVRNGNELVPVPAAIIDEIKARADEQGYIVLARQLKLDRGARISIAGGAFNALEAIFESQRGEDRVVALLSLLGRKVVANVPVRAVMPVD
jgi:transcriptional antiterminator RfaH